MNENIKLGKISKMDKITVVSKKDKDVKFDGTVVEVYEGFQCVLLSINGGLQAFHTKHYDFYIDSVKNKGGLFEKR